MSVREACRSRAAGSSYEAPEHYHGRHFPNLDQALRAELGQLDKPKPSEGVSVRRYCHTICVPICGRRAVLAPTEGASEVTP